MWLVASESCFIVRHHRMVLDTLQQGNLTFKFVYFPTPPPILIVQSPAGPKTSSGGSWSVGHCWSVPTSDHWGKTTLTMVFHAQANIFANGLTDLLWLCTISSFRKKTFSSTGRWIAIKMRNYRIIVAAMARPGSYHLVRAGSQEDSPTLTLTLW